MNLNSIITYEDSQETSDFLNGFIKAEKLLCSFFIHLNNKDFTIFMQPRFKRFHFNKVDKYYQYCDLVDRFCHLYKVDDKIFIDSDNRNFDSMQHCLKFIFSHMHEFVFLNVDSSVLASKLTSLIASKVIKVGRCIVVQVPKLKIDIETVLKISPLTYKSIDGKINETFVTMTECGRYHRLKYTDDAFHCISRF